MLNENVESIFLFESESGIADESIQEETILLQKMSFFLVDRPFEELGWSIPKVH